MGAPVSTQPKPTAAEEWLDDEQAIPNELLRGERVSSYSWPGPLGQEQKEER
mgnify:CR=1 FL=1